MTSRKPLPGREIVQSLEVVCTDRGQHPRLFIARVRWHADGSKGMPMSVMARQGNRVADEDDDRAWPSWDPPTPSAEPGTGSHHSYTFWCRRCGRETQVRHERWWAAMDQCYTAGIPVVDLSRLGG